MRKSPPADFKIHVDPSCMSDPIELEMPPERTTSNETVIHHDPEPGNDHRDDEGQPVEGKDEIQEFLDELSQHDNMSGGEEQEGDEQENEEQAGGEKAGDQYSDAQDIAGEDPAEDAGEAAAGKLEAKDREEESQDKSQNEEEQEQQQESEEHDVKVQDEGDQSVLNHEDARPEGVPNKENVWEQEQREMQDERTEALIQAAARAVVASIEQDSYDDHNEDSVLSAQTDESYDQSASELTYDEGTEMTYGEGTEVTYDGTEDGETQDSETERLSEHGEDETQDSGTEDQSENGEQKPEEPGTEDRSEHMKEETQEPGIRHYSEHGDGEALESETEHRSEQGDSSSQHDGDIDEDDDVFSHESDHSKRSSLNSSDGQHSGEEAYQGKVLTSPAVGEEAAREETTSRIPSVSSYRETAHTPNQSRVLSRPPFRTPSSVRAMQMSSPPQSLFVSPRSSKRQAHMPTVSRLGSPSGHNSENSQSLLSPTSSRHKTPTRIFKTKTEPPLVLLHVTVLPLQFPYADIMNLDDEEIPVSLSGIKDSWRLLQEKLGEQVFARGVLLSHPQDSYEVLEERLLETLELPVCPRARILKCGHYMGPEDSTSAEDSGDDLDKSWGSERKPGGRGWCDICCRNISFEENVLGVGEKKLRVKIYASNGLMKAGAWAAAWREMERVDVEIGPFVEADLLPELEHLQSKHRPVESQQEEHCDEKHEQDHPEQDHVQEKQVCHQAVHAEMEEEEATRRKAIEEERLREMYWRDTPRAQSPRETSRSRSRAPKNTDSLPELLLAAVKVAMRDKKNVLICVLSALVLVFALKPRGNAGNVSVHRPAYKPERIVSNGCENFRDLGANPLEVMPENLARTKQVTKEDVQPRVRTAPKKTKKQPRPFIDDEEDEAEEEEAVPVVKKGAKKVMKQSPPPVEEEDDEYEVEARPKAKKAPKKVEMQQPPTEEEYEVVERPKTKKAIKKVEATLPDEQDDEEEESAIETSIQDSDSQAFDLEVPGEEVVQPIEQDHYHLEPPSQKKMLKKKVVKDAVRFTKGVEPVSQRRRT